MRSGWSRRPLGELMALDLERVEVEYSQQYLMAGVFSFGRGLLLRDSLPGSATAYKHLHRLNRGQFVMSKLKAWEGALAVVTDEFDGRYLSPEFPTFTLGPDLLPSYMALLAGREDFWLRLRDESTGMGGRRERVHPRRLLSVEVDVPPVVEQRRIIDLIDAVDENKRAAAEAVVALRAARTSVRDAALASDRWTTMVPLSEVTTKIGSGATPRGGESAYHDVGLPLIRSQNVHDERFVVDGLVYLDSDQAGRLEGATVEPGDVLMNITGASVNRVCAAPQGLLPARVNQHVAILRPDQTRVDSAYLVQVLRRSDFKAALDVLAAGGGTTRQALTKSQLERFEIPVPTLDQQRAATRTVESVTQAEQAVNVLIERITTLRVSLLDDLLTGEHPMPASYDALLGAA